jgi:hypothetical protein
MTDHIIIDVNTGDITERAYTKKEKDIRKELESSVTLPEPIVDNSEEIRQSALDKLTALGLTEEEARTIVGI